MRAALQEAQNTPYHPGATTGLFCRAFTVQCEAYVAGLRKCARLLSLLVPWRTYLKLAAGLEHRFPPKQMRAALQEAQNTTDHPGAATGLFLQAFVFQC